MSYCQKRIAEQMSNVMYNLCQLEGHKLTERDCKTMKKLSEEWNKVKNER